MSGALPPLGPPLASVLSALGAPRSAAATPSAVEFLPPAPPAPAAANAPLGVPMAAMPALLAMASDPARELRDPADDAALRALMDEVELRVRVELAKYDRRV